MLIKTLKVLITSLRRCRVSGCVTHPKPQTQKIAGSRSKSPNAPAETLQRVHVCVTVFFPLLPIHSPVTESSSAAAPKIAEFI